MKRIFIVDDHPALREGLRALVKQAGGYQVCGEAASVAEAMETIGAAGPDLVVTDLTLPDRNGVEMIKDLRALYPDLKILVFSMHDEMLYAERSIKAGATGYLMKGAKTAKLFEAIGQVLSGKVYLSQKMAGEVLAGMVGRRSPGLRLSVLSDRELEVFELLGRGRSSAQISEQLSISSKTVDAHRGNIRHKLNLADNPSVLREAVLWVEMGSKASEAG